MIAYPYRRNDGPLGQTAVRVAGQQTDWDHQR